MRYGSRIAGLAFCLFASAGAFAAQITGTVTNGTTNRPSSGDEVTLLSLASGMEEVGKTKTDSQGHYKLNVPDEGAPCPGTSTTVPHVWQTIVCGIDHSGLWLK